MCVCEHVLCAVCVRWYVLVRWCYPSCTFTALYLLRKLLMCTRRIRLQDHEMERLKLLKHKLSDHWQEIVALAEEDQK